eukprot:scaffold4097_cov306-Pinguiococcus_pyrenoidosus.AAC.14
MSLGVSSRCCTTLLRVTLEGTALQLSNGAPQHRPLGFQQRLLLLRGPQPRRAPLPRAAEEVPRGAQAALEASYLHPRQLQIGTQLLLHEASYVGVGSLQSSGRAIQLCDLISQLILFAVSLLLQVGIYELERLAFRRLSVTALCDKRLEWQEVGQGGGLPVCLPEAGHEGVLVSSRPLGIEPAEGAIASHLLEELRGEVAVAMDALLPVVSLVAFEHQFHAAALRLLAHLRHLAPRPGSREAWEAKGAVHVHDPREKLPLPALWKALSSHLEDRGSLAARLDGAKPFSPSCASSSLSCGASSAAPAPPASAQHLERERERDARQTLRRRSDANGR